MIRATVFCLALWAGGAEAACRQALALGLDVSGSVDAAEYRLQREGLATALTSPAVRAVFFAEGAAPVRIAVFEWSGPTDQAVILGWTTLSDVAVLDDVADRLRRAPRPDLPPTTALGAAMLFGAGLLADQTACWKRTLDISGDGEANTGPRPQHVALPDALSDVVINGLVIGSAELVGGGERGANIRALSRYFEAYVIRGDGAFVETALGFEDYAAAMERKLLRELQAIAVSSAETRTPARAGGSPSAGQ